MANDRTPPDVLAEFAAAHGAPHAVAGNRPIQLDDSGAVWFVEDGAIDVLAAEYDDDRMQSPFKHVMRLERGRLAFGANPANHSLRLVAKGLQFTGLRCLPLDRMLDELRRDGDGNLVDAVIGQADAWIGDLALAVAGEIEGRPRAELRLTPGAAPEIGIASTERGVVWVAAENLDASFLDLMDSGPDGMMPVTRDTWIELRATAGVACRSSRELGIGVLLRSGLPEFHRLALGTAAMNRRMLLVDDANLQVAQATLRRREKTLARNSLSALTEPARDCEGDGELLGRALRMIGGHEGIRIRMPSRTARKALSLGDYCDASGVRERRVRLSIEDRWWLGDSGAMLAFRRDDESPVVLLPGRAGRYRIVDPATGESSPADAETTNEIHNARMLHPKLESDGSATLRDLFRAGGAKAAPELGRLAATGLAAGLLALAPAVVVNLLVGEVIPNGAAASLVQYSAVLVGLAFVAALSHVLRGTALMRMEGRAAARLGLIVWDRLLRLRSGFFRRFNAGELATRANVFQEVRDHVAGVAADAVLSTLFLLPAFGLLLFYDATLGWAVSGVSLVALALMAGFCMLHFEPQRRYLESSRELAGDLHQYLSGVTKLRIAGAEDSAFAAWARRYREQKLAQIRLAVLTERLVALSAGVPALATAALFAGVALRGADGLSTADFLAIHTAAMVFCMSIVMLGNSLKAVSFIGPACDQVRPILASPVDSGVRSGARPTLQGEILLDKVSFRYPNAKSDVLREVSIHARPGEFVAIVGESGAGKSTVFRLALGLEMPSSGAVYYDGQHLAHLDLTAVRRQLGVVTQDGSLPNGTILEAIVGIGDDLSAEDAWRAAGMAAVEEEIRAMPMEMHTTVGENAATFSGGQGQRIRIAAALVRNPSILFLDEPTSWLDARSQALTMQGIVGSASTRIIIAHRLSTIRQADRIYVLETGRVVQVGGFEELVEKDGPFRKLALRQMA